MSVSAGGACTYSYACNTWVSNRSLVTDTGVTLDAGIRVVLSGQPLAVAGGVLMRLRQMLVVDSLVYSVDFPQLVGDQYNEFLMDVTGGLPCVPPAPVQVRSAPLQLSISSLFGARCCSLMLSCSLAIAS